MLTPALGSAFVPALRLPFDPAAQSLAAMVRAIFATGITGAQYVFGNLSSLYQDSAGITPVTAVEQPVGLVLDSEYGLVRGPELVVNGDGGTFTTGISGITPFGSATVSRDTSVFPNGSLKIVSGGVNTGATIQSFTTVVGKTYQISGSLYAPSSNATSRAAALTCNSGGGVPTEGVQVSVANTIQNLSYTFVAVSTTTVVYGWVLDRGIAWGLAGDVAYFDNISVKLLDGNHASQATAAARPVLSSRVNLVANSGFESNFAGWSSFAACDIDRVRLIDDSFTRANGAIGNTETGEPWLQVAAGGNSVLALISDNRLVAPASGGSVTAAYSGIDLGVSRTVVRMDAVISFGVGAVNGAAVLISNPNGLSTISQITDGSLHIVFTDIKCDVAYFSSGILNIVSTYTYPSPLQQGGPKYSVGWELFGSTLNVFMPDGTTQIYINANFATYAGRYCTFEHFFAAGQCAPVFFSASIDRTAKFGSACWKLDNTGSGNGSGTKYDFTVGTLSTQYTIGVWIYSAITCNVDVSLFRDDFGDSFGSGYISVPSRNWTKIQITGTTSNVGSWKTLLIRASNTVTVWLVDGLQIETGSVATRYQNSNTATDYDTVGFPSYLKYDGIDDSLSSATGGGGTAGFFFCAAVQLTGGSGTQRALWADDNRPANTGYIVAAGPSNQLVLYAGTGTTYSVCAGGPLVVGNKYLITAWDDGVNLNVQVDNGAVTQVARPAVVAGMSSFFLGRSFTSTEFLPGNLYTATYWKNTAGTAAQRATVQAYVRQQAGL